MSDLSRLLGDVYGSAPNPPQANGDRHDEQPAGTGTDEGAGAPDWADEEVLDRAFEGWVAGPPDEAPAAERSMLADLADAPPPPPTPVDEERVERIHRIVPLESLLDPGAATVDGAPHVEAEPEVATEPAAAVAPVAEPEVAAEPVAAIAPEAPEVVVVEPVTEPEVAPEAEQASLTVGDPVVGGEPADASPAWDRSQDDILPRRAARGFLRRR